MLNSMQAVNPQNYEEPKAHVFNPTLEEVRTQANSRGFRFKSLELTEIPLSMAEIIGNKIGYRGLFVVWPNQNISDLDHVKMQALRNFKIFNDERILMEQTYLDERRKAGITIDMKLQNKYNKWSKWSQELAVLLKQNNVIEESKSFLTGTELKIEESPKVKRRGRPSSKKEEVLM